MARDLQTCANKLEKLYRRPVSFFAEDIEDLLFGGVLHKFLHSRRQQTVASLDVGVCKAASLSLRNPRIYTNTTPAVVQGSRNQRQTTPRTPAGLVLVYILGARIHRTCRPRAWSFFAYMQAAHEAQVEESAQRSKLSPSSGPKEITRPGAPYPRKPWTRACFALGIHGTWYSRDLVFHRLSIFRLRVTPWLLSTDRRLGQTSSRSCVRWCGTEELGQVRR